MQEGPFNHRGVTFVLAPFSSQCPNPMSNMSSCWPGCDIMCSPRIVACEECNVRCDNYKKKNHAKTHDLNTVDYSERLLGVCFSCRRRFNTDSQVNGHRELFPAHKEPQRIRTVQVDGGWRLPERVIKGEAPEEHL